MLQLLITTVLLVTLSDAVAGDFAGGGLVSVDGPDAIRQLHTPSLPVDITDPSLPELIIHMHNIMQREGGDGIAAVQIGIPQRIFLLKRNQSDNQVMINPELIAVSKQQIRVWDGCLSIQQGFGRISRADTVTISYQTTDGTKLVEEMTGQNALIVQHEMDHLAGRLFTDYIPGARLIPRADFFKLQLVNEFWCEQHQLDEIACEATAESLWNDWQQGL